MSVFDTMERSELQDKVLSGEIDSDCLLKDLVQWVTLVYYNLFANLDTGEHRACPVSRRGNAAYAVRQSFKKSMLAKLIKKNLPSLKKSLPDSSHISSSCPSQSIMIRCPVMRPTDSSRPKAKESADSSHVWRRPWTEDIPRSS